MQEFISYSKEMGKIFRKRLTEELNDLNMSKTVFKVSISNPIRQWQKKYLYKALLPMDMIK